MRDRYAMGIYHALSVPGVLTGAGIDDALLRSSNRILLAGMSRFDFADCAYHGADLRALPIGHLLDHRIRGTLLPPIADTPNRTIAEAEWSAAAPAIEEWLGHMLGAGDQLGARALVADALKLDPRRDASQLVALGLTDRALFRHCIRGCLASAIRRTESLNLAQTERAHALALIARLLVYFASFSLQIIAARAWWIDHLPFRDDDGPGPYREAALWRDSRSIAETINHIGAYIAGKRPRYPNRGPVTTLKPQARRWRDAYALTDDELRDMLIRFYAGIAPVVRNLRKVATHMHRKTALANRTVHKALFGVTSGEALAFAATRLVQLRDCRDDLVAQAAAGGATTFAVQAAELPRRDDPDVATILYVLRITLLQDPAASLER